MHHTDEQINSARQMTDDIRACVNEGDWQRASKLASERQALLDTLFHNPVESEHVTHALQALSDYIRGSDAHSREKTATARKKTGTDLAQIKLGRKATNTYQDIEAQQKE